MASRVFIEKGPAFKFRVSRPGKDTSSTNLDDFIIHEALGVAAPYETDEIAVPANSNVLINFGRTYANPALIMLKPVGVVAYLTQFEARIQSNMSSMRIYNHTGTARSVTYYVYWNSIG
ncbi:hypothetical protein G3A39_41605 [Paraburkholderia aspalathi]|nr:hypothetical protein [Paraburkholderia aspalathi]